MKQSIFVVGLLSIVLFLIINACTNTGTQSPTDTSGQAYKLSLRPIRYNESQNQSTNQTTTFCTDSDGGVNYYVNGTVIIRRSSGHVISILRDKCVSPSQLIEYYCRGGTYEKRFTTCSYGCRNGGCNLPPRGGTNTTNVTTYPPQNMSRVNYTTPRSNGTNETG